MRSVVLRRLGRCDSHGRGDSGLGIDRQAKCLADRLGTQSAFFVGLHRQAMSPDQVLLIAAATFFAENLLVSPNQFVDGHVGQPSDFGSNLRAHCPPPFASFAGIVSSVSAVVGSVSVISATESSRRSSIKCRLRLSERHNNAAICRYRSSFFNVCLTDSRGSKSRLDQRGRRRRETQRAMDRQRSQAARVKSRRDFAKQSDRLTGTSAESRKR